MCLHLALAPHNVTTQIASEKTNNPSENIYIEPPKKIPTRNFDVVVVGGGTAGLFAALAAALQGAKTIVIESKVYCGGIAFEGGTAIHSFYNLRLFNIYN